MANDTDLLNWAEDHLEETYVIEGLAGDSTIVIWLTKGGHTYMTEGLNLRDAIRGAMIEQADLRRKSCFLKTP